jgi:hypothetical protein
VEKNSFRKINEIGKGLGFVLLTLFTALMVSCEDSGLINFANRKNNLQTIYVDTFSVVTSTVLLDSIPTSNSNAMLIGNYADNLTGNVTASTYFQISYLTKFSPETTSIYDSAALIMPYARYSYGDTTQSVTLNVHELTQSISLRQQPPFSNGEKASPFKPASALYNTSKVSYSPVPLATTTVKFTPHRDSLYIRLPKAFGQSLYNIETFVPDVVKIESSRNNWFVSNYFKGLHIKTDQVVPASIASFNASRTKIRVYYRMLVDGQLVNVHVDFPFFNNPAQFNNIKSDRSSSPLVSLGALKALSSNATSSVSYIQSGVGVYTKLEFPSLKGFLKDKNKILIDATLEVNAVQRSYFNFTKAPAALSVYSTDQSNIILGGIASSSNSILTAPIVYDNEYGLNTKYTFSLINFVAGEIASDLTNITPLALVQPPSNQNSFSAAEVSRVAIGDKFHPTNKIKLKIYYSQHATNQ